MIEDIEAPLVGVRAPDQLRFAHVMSTDVLATRDGLDLVIEVLGTTDVLRVKNQFEGEAIDPLLGLDISPDTEMYSIVFADGVIWDRLQIAEAVSHPLDSDDVVIGSQTKDILEGGRGSDVMRGGRDGDIYIFREGDGDDRIADDNDRPSDDPVAKSDLLQFGGDFNADNLSFRRAGESDDIEILILDIEGQETGDRIYVEGQFDWINVPFLGLMFPDAIERFGFQDGSFLKATDVMSRVLQEATTDGADAIFGFNNADTLDGGGGNDVLVGRAQNDTYIYGRNYGSDVVSDRDDDFFTPSNDVIRFKDDLRWSDFTFQREGDSPTITMTVQGTDNSLTLDKQFKRVPFQGFVNRIERLDFANGTSWDWAKLGQHVIDLSSTDADDVMYGFDIDDLMDGGIGDDRLEGGDGADTYVFGRGYGSDVIFDTDSSEQGDSLLLRDILLDDVDFLRAGDNLTLIVRESGDQVTLASQYARGGAQVHAIETFKFADQSVDLRNLNPEDIDLIGTAAGETLEGTNFSELIDGRAGDDVLIGFSDGDTYMFDVGYGHDVVIDQQVRVAWPDQDGKLQRENGRHHPLRRGYLTRLRSFLPRTETTYLCPSPIRSTHSASSINFVPSRMAWSGLRSLTVRICIFLMWKNSWRSSAGVGGMTSLKAPPTRPMCWMGGKVTINCWEET